MRFLVLLILVFAASPLVAESFERSDRDRQWLFKEKLGSGNEIPSAVFLSWNYSSVIFLATCREDRYGNPGKAGNGGLTFNYFPGEETVKKDKDGFYKASDFPPFQFERGAKMVEIPTKVARNSVKASFDISAQLLAILKPGEKNLEIYAEMQMGEPWYAGQAEPLYRLAKTCKAP